MKKSGVGDRLRAQFSRLRHPGCRSGPQPNHLSGPAAVVAVPVRNRLGATGSSMPGSGSTARRMPTRGNPDTVAGAKPSCCPEVQR